MRWMLAVCLLCLGAAAGAASEPNWGAWAEEVRKQHPLAGSVYVERKTPTTFVGNVRMDFTAKGTLSRPARTGRGLLLPAGIVLLGEVHDNPAHHQVRAWLIENSAKASRPSPPAVVFEQIRADQQPALDRYKVLTEAGGTTADDLFRLLEWDKSGWPSAGVYKPLFEAVVAARLPIFAGNLPNDQVRAVARGGTVAPEDRARLKLDNPMPASLAEALNRELADGHCGMLPPEAIGRMAAAQRYRDAHLADALLSAQQRHGAAILIAGNGHVRSDRGVPWHIRQRAPETRVKTVVLVEVEQGKADPSLYVPRDPEGRPAADLVIFTPRAERGDPCAAMRKHK